MINTFQMNQLFKVLLNAKLDIIILGVLAQLIIFYLKNFLALLKSMQSMHRPFRY